MNDIATLTGKQFLGSGYSAKGHITFVAVDPTTNQDLPGTFFEATPDEIDLAMNMAAGAHRKFNELGRDQRAIFLETIAHEIESLGDALLERASQETGLPKARLEGERGRTVGQLRMFAGVIRDTSYLGIHKETADPERSPLPKPDLRLIHRALGSVVVFGASNFPLAYSVAGGDTASALAAGCPVVVKAHPAHPGCSELVASAIQKAVARCGLPEGTFSMVHGASPDVGRQLVEHVHTKAVGFTGSLAGGRALFDLAAKRPSPIPVFAEMGSTNPLFLLPGRVAQAAQILADGLTASVSLGVGQFCTSPGLVFVIKDNNTEIFLSHLGAAFESLASGIMLHAGIRSNWEAGLQAQMDIEGVEVVGQSNAGAISPTEATPTVLSCTGRTFLQNPVLTEEVFGPSTLVVMCDDASELLATAKALPGQLTAGIHATDDDDLAELLFVLEERAGRIVFGGYPTGVEVCSAMQHGGPYPATTDSRFSAVGSRAIARFLRPVSYQNAPQGQLPIELRD